jgi:hypothetical protein
MDALAKGASSNEAKSSPSGAPRSASTTRRTSSNELRIAWSRSLEKAASYVSRFASGRTPST